jgi:hypothetical protein
MTVPATDPVSAWHRLAGTSVLLDGFHAVKHAVRFGAEIPVAVTADRRAALALAAELAPDTRDTLAELLTEVPAPTPPWPYGRPARATSRSWRTPPAPRPSWSWTTRATSATRAP